MWDIIKCLLTVNQKSRRWSLTRSTSYFGGVKSAGSESSSVYFRLNKCIWEHLRLGLGLVLWLGSYEELDLVYSCLLNFLFCSKNAYVSNAALWTYSTFLACSLDLQYNILTHQVETFDKTNNCQALLKKGKGIKIKLKLKGPYFKVYLFIYLFVGSRSTFAELRVQKHSKES